MKYVQAYSTRIVYIRCPARLCASGGAGRCARRVWARQGKAGSVACARIISQLANLAWRLFCARPNNGWRSSTCWKHSRLLSSWIFAFCFVHLKVIIYKNPRFQTRDSWRLARAKKRRRDGIMECLHYSSQIFSVCVFTVSLRNGRRKEGRKEALTYRGFFFCLCVLGEGFSAGRERCRTWHIKRKLYGLLSTRSRPAMWVLKSVLFLCILSFFLMGFWSIQMGSESSQFRTENG
jgi:hypothetical protein